MHSKFRNTLAPRSNCSLIVLQEMKLSIKFVSAALVSFVSLSKAIDGVAVVSNFEQDDKETKEEQQHQHRSLQVQVDQRWKDRTGDVIIVPYAIVGTFSATSVALIDRSVKDLGDRSNVVQFVRRTNQRAYIAVRNDANGCFSSVGRVGSGTSQTLNLGNGCLTAGIIQHEFLHAVRVRGNE